MTLKLKIKHTPAQLAILETIKNTLTPIQREVLYDVFTVPITNLVRNHEEALARDNLVFHLGVAECGHVRVYDLSQVFGVSPRPDDPNIRPPWNGENGNKP